MTSPPEQVEVECPECGELYEDWYRPSINADLDPQMIEDSDYLDQASSTTCPKCGHKIEIAVLIARGLMRPAN